MVFFRIIVFLSAVFLPTALWAWGPLTHVYLGSEIFYLGSLIPPAIFGLMRKYRQDYLYGNIMADTIIAKKYLPREKSCHNWDVAVNLYESAETDSERAFSLGYMSHLAADTVAHGIYTVGLKNFKHSLLEFKADKVIDKSYWFRALSIRKRVQRRNDAFLEKSLERVVFSFKTNRMIFKSVVALSGLNQTAFGNLVENNLLLSPVEKVQIENLHEESLDRMLDVMVNGPQSAVLEKAPFCDAKPLKVLKTILR
jgi:hypothetical protein